MSVSCELVIESSPGEARAALLDDSGLAELLVFRRNDPPRLGETCQGRILRIERGINAAFVEIGAGPPGFLPLTGAARGATEGKTISVTVAGEAAPGKGPRLAVAKETPPSRPRDTDLAVAAMQALLGLEPARIVADGAACYARLRAALRDSPLSKHLNQHPGPAPAFESFGIDEQIERALAPELALASGLRLHFDETAALAAVDVDAASFAPRKGARATALAANLAAAPALAREIRLRNLSGLILIDFLRMKDSAERKRLTDSFAEAVAADPVPVHIHGFTRGGLLEFTRERRRRPLSQVLLQPRAPRRKSAETIGREALRAAARTSPRGLPLTLAAAPDVIAWLEGEGRDDLAAVESLLHVKLSLRQVGSAGEKFEVLEPAR